MFLEMARTKSMGLGAMFVLLVLAVIVLPVIVKFVSSISAPHYAISGFSDGPTTTDESVSSIPTIGSMAKLPTWRPDRNTDYLCRSPNENGIPCPTGQFCDGYDQTCKDIYIGGTTPSTGYYA